MINIYSLGENYGIKIIVLFVFWKIIKLHPNVKLLKKQTAFSVYRSLLCLNFMLYSLENLICNFSDLFTDPYCSRDCYNDISDWFIVYSIFDIIKMIMDGNTRKDLYIHHVWCLISFIISKFYGKCSAILNASLLAEAISIVSGIDLIAMEKENMKESYYYKKYRKMVIKYFRLPLWIILLVLVVKNTRKTPSLLWYNFVFSSIVMIGLDQFWEKKCNKVIEKYKKNS